MNLPGKNFLEMLTLIIKNHRNLPSNPFSPQLLMAIFWEESLFNNMRQVGKGGRPGPAIGFGQVERQELPKLSTSLAKEKDYFVPGMETQPIQVPDDTSVQIASCMLLHLFHASQSSTIEGKVDFALRGYSGNRREIISGWQACERNLKSLPFTLYRIINYEKPLLEFENRVMDALSLTRPFYRNFP